MTGKRTLCLLMAFGCAFTANAFGARMRPGCNPPSNLVLEDVIWGDPFDNYDEWSITNNQIWPGGPTPAGSSSGTFVGIMPAGVAPDCIGFPSPQSDTLIRNQWQYTPCPAITVPMTHFVVDGAGVSAGIHSKYSGGDPRGSDCYGDGQEAETLWSMGYSNTPYHVGWGYTALPMYNNVTVTDRINNFPSRAWDDSPRNSINGTDEHPLVLTFYMYDNGSYNNAQARVSNSYVELNFNDDHAPTDYVWRGHNYATVENPDVKCPEYQDPPLPADPECCPQGPYPVICQQQRVVNAGNDHEDGAALAWLNSNCPPLVAPEVKTWKSIAVGWMAILDKNPCAYNITTEHRPAMNHLAIFDGNMWREMRPRGDGNMRGLATNPPYPACHEEDSMALGVTDTSDMSLGGGLNIITLKITTDWVLVYMKNKDSTGADKYWDGAFRRIYKGGFNRVAWGVGPGCELDSSTYQCKSGAPTQCLTYGWTEAGYFRSLLDNVVMLGGKFVYTTDEGACCLNQPGPDNCQIMVSATCAAAGGQFAGAGTTCLDRICCPRPFADATYDGAVDQDDFGAFQVCYTGTAGGVPTGCTCFDTNNDGVVDGTDLTAFLNCWTGPNVPWTAALTPLCVP